MTDVAGMDFNAMSTDELKAFLDSGGNPESKPDVQDDEAKKPETDVEKEPEKPEPEPEKPGETGQGTQDGGSEESPFYKGKTREDIIAMQENATRKISSLGNENYHLKKQLEALQTKLEKPETNEEDEIFKSYDQQDLAVIDKVIEKRLSAKEAAQREQTEAQKKAARDANDEFWKNLREINLNSAKLIEEKVLNEVRANPDATYHQKDWLKNNWKKYLPSETAPDTPPAKPADSTVTVTRKVKAATVGSGSGAGLGNQGQPKKTVNQMSAEEYREHMMSQGIDLKKGVITA